MTKHRTESLFICLAALTLAAALTGCVGDGGGLPTDTVMDDATGDADVGADTTPSSDTTVEDSAAPDLVEDTLTATDTSTATDTAVSDTTTPTDTAEADTTTADTSATDTTDTTDTTDPDVFMCQPGTDDCDGDPANGCEPLDTLDNCGACGASCALANATASCDTGSCELAMCDENTGDCDGDPANGCEDDWGPAGGACCQVGAVQLDLSGVQTRWADQGTWAIYKNGGALAESLHCPSEWDTPQVADALAPGNRPVDLVWRRNCPAGGVNDGLPELAVNGSVVDGVIIVSDPGLGEVYRVYGQFQVVSHVLLPNTASCTEAEQITLRLF